MAKKKNGEADNGNGNGEPKALESKADRFRRLANKRLAKAEKAIAAIANLANTSSYEYTDDQRDKVVNVIIAAVNRVDEAFNRQKKTTGVVANYV